MVHKIGHGASGTNMNDQQFGILKTLSGSAEAGQQAMNYANQLYPDAPEADPWEAAFQFFSAMGQAASQPGATVLGSAVGSMQVPMDYLAAKKKEKRETDRARLQTAVQLAPSLKADAGSKYTKRTLYKPDGSTIDVYSPTQEKAAIDDGWGYQKAAGTGNSKYTKRTLYKPDGSKIDVYSDIQEKAAVDAGWGYQQAAEQDDKYTKRTLYKPDGSTIDVYSATQEKAAIDDGWGYQKSSSKTEKFTKRSVYKDGQEKIVYTKADYDTAKGTGDNGGWSDIKPASTPQGSAGERLTTRVIGFVDNFVVDTNAPVKSSDLAQFISDVKDMAKTDTITFIEKGVSKTASSPGKDAYKIIEEAYGIEVANKIRELASQEISSDDDDDDDDDDKVTSLTETIVIAGKEYTVFSSKDPSIPKEAVQGIVDSTGGMGDIKIASDLIFPNGVFNKGLVIASNVMPGGGIGPEGSLTGDARTAYQAMKRSIELLLRARSGAAVPPAEVENYMNLYYPASLDNESQARNKLNVLAQYFADTNRLLSQGKLNDGKYDPNKHGIPVTNSVSNAASESPAAVTVISEWTLDGVKYKQLSDGRIITEEAE